MRALISRLLDRKAIFYSLVLALLLVAGLNLYAFRHDFEALAVAVLPGEDGELARWQRWAAHYDRLFGMLVWDQPVAVRLEGCRSSGFLVSRDADGMTVERSLFLRFRDPAVILTFERAAADRLLGTVPHTEPDAIWQMMKDALNAREVTLWNDPDVGRLHRGGYLAFMRAIDTRPRNMDWPTVRTLLGEELQ